MSSFKEAFQEFGELDDVVYDIDNKDDLDRLKKSLDDDEDDLENIEKIVDIEATDEEDLEQSYVGKLLLYCPFCHTIHYANKEDIVESEDDPEYVNVGEQCPECSQIEGFEVIGEVAPVDGAQPDTEQGDETGEEPEEENENDIDLETEFGLPDEDDDEFEESFHRTKKSSFLERLVDNDCKKEDVDFDDNDDEIEIDEKVGAVLPKVRRKVKENLKAKKSLKENLTEAPVYGLEPRYDARKSFYGKAQVDTGDKGDKNKLYSYDTLVAEIKDGKPVVYGTYSQTTLRHIKEWLKQLGFKAENSKQILADYGAKRESCKESANVYSLRDMVDGRKYEVILNQIYEHDDGYRDLVKITSKEVSSKEEANKFIKDEMDRLRAENKYLDDGMISVTLKELEESCKESKKNLKEGFRGCKKVNMVWHGDWADPELVYTDEDGNEYRANYWDIEDGMYEYYKEEHEYATTKDDEYAKSLNATYDWSSLDGKSDDDFNKFVINHEDDVINDIIEYNSVDESCKESKKLNEEVQNEAYEIAEYIYDHIKDRDTITRDEYEEQFALACRELYGIDNVWEIEKDGNIEINGKTFDANELLEGDVRCILAYNGYVTIYEGENEGGLTTKEIEENLKEDSERDILRANIKAQNHAKRQPSLKLVKKDQAPKKDDKECKDGECKKEIKESKLNEDAFNEYQKIIDRAKLNIDDGYSDVDEAIWSAIDEEPYLDDFEILKDNFSINDLYFENGEPVSTIIMELIYNSVYDEVSDYYSEKHNDVEVDESLQSQKRTVEQIKESIKTKLDKTIKEGLENSNVEDEIDENLFDNLINKYCTRVYENVKDYKTTAGYTQGENLVLEGLLSFKSGKTANTKFIFEKKMVKDNQVKYVGLNESFSKSKKAFTLNCKVDNKKIISESLTYNYKVKVNNEKKAVYGSIKNN